MEPVVRLEMSRSARRRRSKTQASEPFDRQSMVSSPQGLRCEGQKPEIALARCEEQTIITPDTTHLWRGGYLVEGKQGRMRRPCLHSQGTSTLADQQAQLL